MQSPALLWIAACGIALAPEPATPPVGTAPCIACRAPVPNPRELFSETDWATLESGAVVRQDLGRDASGPSPVAGQGGASLVPRGPREVWAVLTDFEHWPEFMPLVNETHVERREGGNRLWVAQRYSVLWYPMRHTTVYELDPDDGRLSWHLDPDEPHDIASSEGSWQLVAIEDGRATVVRYQSHISAGRAVPAFLERRLREHSLVQMMSALRDAVLRRYPED
jgi:ribosome-associated toxin RatA of RatAB toxin-antitoxin module